MTASALSTARPPTAAIAWATKDSLFCEIPCPGSAPLIIREHRTAEGLGRLLNVLIEHAERPGNGKAATSVPADHPAIKRTKPSFNEAERQGVRDVLKRMKVI